MQCNYRPVGSGGVAGGGGFSPTGNLLKFADFESEKGCKSQAFFLYIYTI